MSIESTTPPTFFKSKNGRLPLPLFFPDATKGFLRTVDSKDIELTLTPGVLVNTWHLAHDFPPEVLKQFGGIREYMGWRGAVISDSGGFQIMSLLKEKGLGKVTEDGMRMPISKKKTLTLTPEDSINLQFSLGTDLMVVLDDFTPLQSTHTQALETVKRTIRWAKRCKQTHAENCERLELESNQKPYLIAVVQGALHNDLREYCAQELVQIGFDGLGFGGNPMLPNGSFNHEVAELIASIAPKDYLLYGLGIGMPDDIVACVNKGFHVFDCVLPSRDARHKRLYVYTAKSMSDIDLKQSDFYAYYYPDKQKYLADTQPVSQACDCLLCTRYSRGYLSYLFKSQETTALRLATIHNLRFYSILMEKLQR